MATNKRTYPDDYFAWYNDDTRLGIVVKATSNDSTDGLTAGEYDTYVDSSVTKGLRIHFHSKFEELTTASTRTSDLFDLAGLDSGFHVLLLDYVKARMFELQGNEQQAQYYLSKFEKGIKQYPSRRSGVRQMTVPRI
tara:strand:+ start:223 stop:633 length:411 start_codon:yes stop_codon:yes gene_type:complete